MYFFSGTRLHGFHGFHRFHGLHRLHELHQSSQKPKKSVNPCNPCLKKSSGIFHYPIRRPVARRQQFAVAQRIVHPCHVHPEFVIAYAFYRIGGFLPGIAVLPCIGHHFIFGMRGEFTDRAIVVLVRFRRFHFLIPARWRALRVRSYPVRRGFRSPSVVIISMPLNREGEGRRMIAVVHSVAWRCRFR